MFLLQYNILHTLVSVFFGGLIILMFVRMILSWFRLGDGNPVMLFLMRCTEPFISPIRKRLPPMPFFDVSWLFAWTALIVMRALLLQALPAGW